MSLCILQPRCTQPPSGNHEATQKTKGIIIKTSGGRRRGRRGAQKKYTFLSKDFFSFRCVFFFIHGRRRRRRRTGGVLLLSWFPFSRVAERCWCSESAGMSLIPKKIPELDRQVPKVATGGGRGGVSRSTPPPLAYSHWLTALRCHSFRFPLRFAPFPPPPNTHFFSLHFSFFVSKINAQHFRASLSFLLFPVVFHIPRGTSALEACASHGVAPCVR